MLARASGSPSVAAGGLTDCGAGHRRLSGGRDIAVRRIWVDLLVAKIDGRRGCDGDGFGGVLSWARRIAGLPCGRWSKWGVLVFWIAVFAVAGPLAGKLNSAQQNDASAWLPHNAESTQVVELAKRFSPSDVFPALVVYERPDGPVTPADQAKVAADVQRFAGVQDVTGKVLGPIPSQDGRALQGVVPIKVNSEGNGWQQLTPRVEQMRSIAQADAGGLGVYVTGPAGYFADFSKVFSGFD